MTEERSQYIVTRNVTLTPEKIVSLRRIELYDALDELTSLMPPTDEGMTEQTLRKMRHRCGAVINLLYQCSEAVATRDGFSACQSIGPDVALPVGGQGR